MNSPFKNYLAQEKEAVKQIAVNVSEELGSRLLTPTPGTRMILAALVKVRQWYKLLKMYIFTQ